jgi:hypothetical protein
MPKANAYTYALYWQSGIPDSARMGFEEYSLVTKTTGAIGAHGVLMVVAWIFLSQVRKPALMK